MKVAIVGGSFSGNKGAASMVQAVLDEIAERWPGSHISVFTPLLADDRRVRSRDPDVTLVPFGPQDIVLAVLAAIAYWATGGWLAAGTAVPVLDDQDVVVDVSGISFVDGRGLVTLMYNVLLMAVPLLVGRPVVKVAQAMGPFQGALNRAAAELVLPRMTWIAARGSRTAEHLRELDLDNWEPAHDVAFLMRVTDVDRSWAMSHVADRPTAVVSPSMVVAQHPDAGHYVSVVVRVVQHLARTHDVLLVPHASRPGREAGRLNDLPLCEQVRERAGADGCRVVGEEAGPEQLRALIGLADVLVTSRFHAMISGLAVGTPVLVVGWSHKYREVLEDFGLSEWAVDFRRASVDRVLGDLDELLRVAPTVRATIAAELPRVNARAAMNIDLIQRAVEGGRA